MITVELVPHVTATPREGWTDDHDLRPVTDAGRRQAAALAERLGTGIDAIYSSPALRCRQTVEPVAAACGLPIEVLPELAELGAGSAGLMPGLFAPMAEVLAGAWLAGRAMAAIDMMAARHPRGRVVACTHGDVVPALLSMLVGRFGIDYSRLIERGEWYRLRFGYELVVSAH